MTIQDMDTRVVRIPKNRLDPVRVAPGTDLRDMRVSKPLRWPGLLLYILAVLATGAIIVASIFGMAGA